MPTSSGGDLIELAILAERIACVRRRRASSLPELADMFGEPAWDILLDLFAACVRGRRVSVSSACIASCSATTTALRWLLRLERRGFIIRVADPDDGRRSFVEIDATVFHQLALWLRHAANRLPQHR